MASGGGSIFRRGDGRWIAMVDIGWTATGHRRRKKLVASTRAEARNRLRDYLASMEEAGAAPSARTTVKRYADQWLPKQETRLRPGPYVTMRGHVTKWIIPALGRQLISELSAADIDRIERDMRAAGRSSTTIGAVIGTCRQMLTDARRDGHRVPDVVLTVRRPPRAVSDRDALPPADAVSLLVAAAHPETWPDLSADPTPRHKDGGMVAGRLWSAAQRAQVREYRQVCRERQWAARVDASRWLAALLQGMRQGEALGLMWDHVDLDVGRITIEWEAQRVASGATMPDGVRHVDLGGGMVLLPPKTRAGARVIPMVPLMADALRAWREISPASRHGLVWPRPDGSVMPDALDRLAWRGLQAAAGVRHPAGRPYLVHEARHTTVTLLHAVGAPPEVIIAIVGHSTYASTRPYMHADLSERARVALEGVAGLLAG